MTNTVVELHKLTRLAKEIRAAYDRAQRGQEEWIDGTLALASALAEARLEHVDNIAFGVWLAQNELDHDHLGRTERAALINMAADLPLARIVLQETRRTSWQLIWSEEMQPRLPSARKTDPVAEASATPPEQPSQPEETQKPETDCVEKFVAEGKPSSIRRTSPFHGLPRADEIAGSYQKNMRAALGTALLNKMIRKSLWQLVTEAFDAGFLAGSHADPKDADIRVLLPQTPRAMARRYPLENKAGVERVMTIWPILIAERTALLAKPDSLDEVLRAHQDALHATALAEREAKALEKGRAAMQPGETDVLMFGERFWPRMDPLEYNYAQLAAAAHFFDEVDRMARLSGNGDQSAKSRAMKIRHALKWLQHHLNTIPQTPERQATKRVYQLIDMICLAMERNPTGDTRLPLQPNVHGEA